MVKSFTAAAALRTAALGGIVLLTSAALSAEVYAAPCDGATPGTIVCKDLSSYYTCGSYSTNAVTKVSASQKCCNNQILQASDPSCGSMCGGANNDGAVICTGANTFITCSSQVLYPTSMLCGAGTVCCPGSNGVNACNFNYQCSSPPTGNYSSPPPAYSAPAVSSSVAAPAYGTPSAAGSSSAAALASTPKSYAASSYAAAPASTPAYSASSASAAPSSTPAYSASSAAAAPSSTYVVPAATPSYTASMSAVSAPPPAYTVPPPAVTTTPPNYGAGACTNAADGTVICTSSNTLNICKGGVFASAYSQSCPAGLTCCSNLGRCDVAGCPTPPPSNCTGIADNSITCTSATTFNICSGGQPVNAQSQSCQAGLVCCQNLNRCDVAGCTGSPSYTPAPAPPSYNYNPSAPPAPSGNCSGKPDNYVVCTSATTFNICKGGVKPYGDQTCQTGLMCCESSQSCAQTCTAPYVPPPVVTSYTAPPPVPTTPVYGANPCAGKNDGYIVCRSKTTLNSCIKGGLASPNADISCPPGLECCEGSQACGWPGCYTPYQNPAPTCAGVTNNHIVCTGLTTFNICLNGLFAGVGDQCCPAGTVCCQNLNRCDVAGCAGVPSYTPPYNPPPPPPANPCPNPAGCAGKQDNQIICRSATSFNICSNQTYFGADQNCPSGLVCCDNLNRCDYPGCVGIPSPIPGKTNYNVAPKVSNPGGDCTGKPDNYVVCTATNTLNICLNGIKASKYDQICPAGLTCCEKTQSCEAACPSYVPPVPYVPSCAGQKDGTMFCTGGNTFTLCQGGKNTPSQFCPTNLVCCEGKGSCQYPGCSGPAYIPPSISTPVYTPPTANCSGVVDGHITCTSATTYRICQNGLDASYVDQPCQQGLYCCSNTNRCDVAGCPGSSYIAPAPAPYNPNQCTGVPDGNIYCTSTNTFNMCQYGFPVSSASQTCPSGQVCCAATNRCDVPGCPGSYSASSAAPSYSPPTLKTYAAISSAASTTYNVPLYNPLTSPTLVNCTGLTSNYLRCSSGSTFNFCYNGAPVSAYDQSCPAGLVCCEASQRCDYTCSAPPPAYVVPSPPPYVAPQATCSGKPNNYVVCTGTSTFNICNNGGFGSFYDQKCPTGQVCCQNTQRCDDPSCPAPNYAPAPYSGPSCLGVPDNHIVCTSTNTFKYCINNAIYASADITCPAGLVCCQGTNRCDVAGCPGTPTPVYTPITLPTYNLPAPAVAPSCAGRPDGSIACRSAYTFNTCVNNNFYWAADQSCALGTVCCADTNLCDFPANCKTVLPVSGSYVPAPAPSCAGVIDGNIVCVSNNQFLKCQNNQFVPSAPLTCAYGTVCCADTNLCDFASNCKKTLPPLPPVNYVNIIAASNVCAGVADSKSACVNPTAYTVCLNQMPATVATACPAGSVCFNGGCQYTYGAAFNPCAYSNGPMACVDSSKYVLCLSTVPTTPAMPCAPGTVCCGNACVLSSDPSCALAPGPICAKPPAVPAPVYNAPAPAYTPPTPVYQPVTSAVCKNCTDYNIACTSLTTFTTCQGGKPIPGVADRSCPTGTVCCPSLQQCTWIGECPSTAPYKPLLPDKCSGLPDNTQLCVSATQFNLCWKGQFTTQIPQACAPGTVCCADCNKCLPAAQCKSILPNPYIDPNTALLDPIANVPTDYCAKVPDDTYACVNPVYLAKCKNGVPLQGLTTCPAGKLCSHGSCVDAPSCPLCSGAPDKTRWCTSDTQFVICNAGSAITAPQTCPPNTNCCGNACVAPNHPMCARSTYLATTTTAYGGTTSTITVVYGVTPTPTTTYAPPPAYATPYSQGTCAQCSDNLIRCRSKNSFNFCLAQQFLTSPDLFCAEGTVCCADTNQCDFEYNCKVKLPPACTGQPDKSTICVSGTAYKTCMNGDFLPGVTACGAGYVCSYATNTCQPAAGVVQYLPPLLQPPGVTYFPAAPINVCAGQQDGNVACLNPSQFVLCLGGMPTGAQFVAPGTVCCGNTMTWPTDPKCNNQCVGVDDQHIACSSAYTYTACKNGLSVTAPTACPAGTVCCGNACVASTNSLCGWPGPLYVPPPNTYVPAPATPYVLANYTCPAVPTIPVYVPPKTNPCAGVQDNQMVCLTATTFNTCLNSRLYDASQRSCPDGTVCCAGSSPNVCARPGECPSVLPSVCSNCANNQMICVDSNHYQTCMNGAYYLQVAMPCPAGTICCATTNSCIQAAQCPYTLPPPYNPPAPYVAPVAPANICAGINQGIACVNPSSFAQCVNGAPVYGIQKCAAGTVCSNNACVSPYSPAYTNVCTGVPDTGIACTCSSQFVTCMNQNIFSVPLNCPAGLVCCGNACTYATDPMCAGAPPVNGTRIAYTPTATTSYTTTQAYSPPVVSSGAYYPSIGSVSAVTSYKPAPTGSYGGGASGNVCAGIPDTGIACVSGTQWVTCMNQAVFSQAQSCQAGTVCCQNLCRYSWDPACAVPVSSSYGVPVTNNYTTPTATPVYIPGNATKAAPSTTPALTTVITPAYSAPASTTPAVKSSAAAATTPISTYIAPASSSAAPVSTPAATPVYSAPSAKPSTSTSGYAPQPPAATPLTCATAGDYASVCTGSNTYKYCLQNTYAPNQIESTCQTGQICCPATGTCSASTNCPSYTGAPAANLYPSGSCKPGVDSMYCTSQSAYTLCTKAGGVFNNMLCAAGTVCCPTSNLCDFAYNCPALSGTLQKGSVVTGNDCAGIPDGATLCSADQTSVITCSGGLPLSSATNVCGDGISSFCCDATNTCTTAGNCASVCAGNVGTQGRCKNPGTFVVCDGENIGLTVACPSGNICCSKSNSCSLPADC